MLLKKLFRTLWQYKAQFISMVIMVALGIGVFLGGPGKGPGNRRRGRRDPIPLAECFGEG